MGRRPLDSVKCASGQCTPRISRRQQRIRATLKEIVEERKSSPKNRRFTTVPHPSIDPALEVKKRAKEKQRPIVPRLSLLFRIALKTPLPQGPEDDFEALQQSSPFITSSDDEKDFSIVQSYFAKAQQRCLQNCELPPGGYHEPIGQFSKEEEEKAYHKMFEHIIGKMVSVYTPIVGCRPPPRIMAACSRPSAMPIASSPISRSSSQIV